MSGINFKYTAKPSFRDINGRYTKAHDKMLQFRRTEIKVEARRLVKLAQKEAPEKTGKFKNSIKFRTFVAANSITFKMYTPEPLTTFIVKGTKKHRIVAKNAKFLKFHWANGPAGPGTYYFRSVKHPGTKKNPFINRAYKSWIPGAKKTLNRVSNKFITEFSR